MGRIWIVGGRKKGGENISGRENSWKKDQRKRNKEDSTLTGINNNGNKVKIRPELAGTPMPA